MRTITIGRYSNVDDSAGYVEGVDNAGESWILFLDAIGRPESYWAKRDDSGGVIGEAIFLS